MKTLRTTSREAHSAAGQLSPSSFDFVLSPAHEALEPAEVRGRERDDVRLLVSYGGADGVEHTNFRDIGLFLSLGDLLVINTSATMNAALAVSTEDGSALELHLSTHLPGDLWTVELRRPMSTGSVPFYHSRSGDVLRLSGGGTAILHLPYLHGREGTSVHPTRLWIASLQLPQPRDEYLLRYGFPIQYGPVREKWPLHYFQTVYATETGSAEMPSAGRAFTPELITSLMARGVGFAPLLLHTGVASLEDHEPPYEEWYQVPLQTARRINETQKAGKQVVAVGTTVVRALETVTDEEGTAHPGTGWTDLVITPERSVRAATALLTGFHEPRASHLQMLQSFVQDRETGGARLQAAYAEALREGYLWHEFGDLHLILPG